MPSLRFDLKIDITEHYRGLISLSKNYEERTSINDCFKKCKRYLMKEGKKDEKIKRVCIITSTDSWMW